MSGVVLFVPELPPPNQDRPMVIQQAHKLPEVRLFPPTDGQSNDQSTSNGGQHPRWSSGASHRQAPSTSNRWTVLNAPRPSEQPPTAAVHFFEEPLENWSPFHMRPSNLTAFTASQCSYRTAYRTHSVAIQRARTGWVSSSAKSLELLRQNLQVCINKELDEVIKRYLDKFFTPAIDNIKRNNGDNSVSEEHLHTVCKQILEEAKRMYTGSCTRGSTPLGDNSDSETGSHGEGRLSVALNKNLMGRKRKDSDTDSEASLGILKPAKKKGRPPLSLSGGHSGRVTPSKQGKIDQTKKEGPKWNPERLTKDTQFVMGAKANKALGFAQTRGRLYIKHPDVFKYCGDAEDKQWLYDNNMMAGTGGKAYLLILEDIQELADSAEYRNQTGLMPEELVGFVVPAHMLEKMRSLMNSQRTDGTEKPRPRGRPPLIESGCDPPDIPDSARRTFFCDGMFDDKVLVRPAAKDHTGASSGSTDPSLKPYGQESPVSTSAADDLDLLAATAPSPAQASPFALSSTVLGDTSPVSPCDLQVALDVEPPLSAPFDITECP